MRRKQLAVLCGAAAAALAAELALYLFTGTNCPIKALLGVPCPGCGMTRAVLALLRLDFAGAASMHPLVFLLPAVLLLLLFWKRGRRGVLIVSAALLLVTFVVRLSLAPGEPPLDWKPDAPFFPFISLFLS